MRLVIDISENIYADCLTSGYSKHPKEVLFAVVDSFRKGMVLPKGHGRLIDENNLWFEDIDDISCVTQRNVENAPTIIEADNEVKE